jgi:hypothetical protein
VNSTRNGARPRRGLAWQLTASAPGGALGAAEGAGGRGLTGAIAGGLATGPSRVPVVGEDSQPIASATASPNAPARSALIVASDRPRT